MSTFPRQQPESPKQQNLEEQLAGAEVADFVVQTEGRRLKAEDESYQLRAEVDLKREQHQDGARNEQARTDAEIDREGKEIDAKIDDQARRTGAAMAALESDTETTRNERYFYMGVTAIGVIAAIVLAFLSVGQEGWEYRLSPGIGLLISGGAGLKLHWLARKQGRSMQEGDSRKGEREMDFSGSDGGERSS